MNIMRWDPFRELSTLQRTMNSVFDQSLRRRSEGEEEVANWVPAVDVSETEEAIQIRAELPGIKQADVDIQLSENVLTIKGERKFEKEEKGKTYHRIERAYGSFSRSFSLPASVDRDKIAAAFDTGVLTVTVPKREESKPRQIKVAITSGKE